MKTKLDQRDYNNLIDKVITGDGFDSNIVRKAMDIGVGIFDKVFKSDYDMAILLSVYDEAVMHYNQYNSMGTFKSNLTHTIARRHSAEDVVIDAYDKSLNKYVKMHIEEYVGCDCNEE
jgi:hypothetical protein